MRAVVLALLVPLAAQAFFFGSSSCGCQPARCPAPSCAPPPVAVCPPPPSCGGGGYRGFQPQYAQPQYAPVQQQQPQYFQQAPVAAYAVTQQQQQQGAQAPTEYAGEALPAQSENQEFSTSGQSATIEEESASIASALEASEAAAETTHVDEGAAVEETAPETVVAAEQTNNGEEAVASAGTENTVYDDIATAAQGTAAEEYHAAAQIRSRYHAIRRAPAAFDPKCNSESLKNIIQQNIGDSTSSSKRAIQKAAAEEVGGHVDVICSTGTFSYIVNTEIYCETEKDGITCFAFRQSN